MLNDNELKNELGNLTLNEQVKFMKLLETFNHKGGSSNNSKVNRALGVAKYKRQSGIQGGGGGIFSEFKNMFGGVSEKINSLKNMTMPKILQDINNEIEQEENSRKLEGGKLNKNNIIEVHNNDDIVLNKNTSGKLEDRVGKLENSISLLNETLNNMNNDDNNNHNLKGGGKKKKSRNKSKKKSRNKKKNKYKQKRYKLTSQKKPKRKTKS